MPFFRSLYTQATSQRKIDTAIQELRQLSIHSRHAHEAMGNLVILFVGMRLLNAESTLSQWQVRTPGDAAQMADGSYLVQVIESAQKRLDEINQELPGE